MNAPGAGPTIRSYLTFAAMFVLSLAALLCAQGDFADDPGVGWHLADGRWITEHRAVPRTDPFLAASAPRQWLSDQWLSDLCLWGLYDLGEWSLLRSAFFVLFLGVFAWIVRQSVIETDASCMGADFGSLVALKLSLIHFILRPVGVGILFFALTCLAAAREFRHRELALLPMLFCLWSNCHPSFLFGLIVLAISVLPLHRGAPVRLRRLCTVGACAIATLVNPYGWRLHESILTLGKSSFFMSLNEEWRPIELWSVEGVAFVSVVLAIALVVALQPQRSSIGRLAGTCLFAFMTAGSVRILPFFAIYSAPLVAEAFSYLERRFTRPASAFRPSVRLSSSLLALAFIFSLCSVPETGPSERRYPYEALSLLMAEGPGSVVLSTPDWGGFITFWGRGEIKAVIDDRNTLLGEEFYRRYFAAIWNPVTLRQFAVSAGATHMLFPAGTVLKGMEHSRAAIADLAEVR